MSEKFRNLAKRLYRGIPFKQPLYELVRKGPTLPHSLYQHLHFEGPFSVQVDRSHAFQIYSEGTQIENELFWCGYGDAWEAMSLRIWAELCKTSHGPIIDIGANTGVYALTAAALRQDVPVIAFEPLERMAARLKRNVELNDFPIKVEQMAVSDRSGVLPIFDTMVEHNYSASLEGQGPSAASYDVEVCALDEYLDRLGCQALGAIKIDVERHEPAVLRGMKRSLAIHRPPLLIEILDAQIGQQVTELIDGLGYRVFHIDEKAGLVSAATAAPLGERNWNHLLVAPDHFERAGLQAFVAPSALKA